MVEEVVQTVPTSAPSSINLKTMNPQMKSTLCRLLKTKTQVMKHFLLQYFTIPDLLKFTYLCKGTKKFTDPNSLLFECNQKSDKKDMDMPV